jgi:hypothetical protein
MHNIASAPRNCLAGGSPNAAGAEDQHPPLPLCPCPFRPQRLLSGNEPSISFPISTPRSPPTNRPIGSPISQNRSAQYRYIANSPTTAPTAPPTTGATPCGRLSLSNTDAAGCDDVEGRAAQLRHVGGNRGASRAAISSAVDWTCVVGGCSTGTPPSCAAAGTASSGTHSPATTSRRQSLPITSALHGTRPRSLTGIGNRS